VANLDKDERNVTKSEYELNQEALMKAVTDLTKLVAEINGKIDTQYTNFVKFARAGKF